jgi:hypothetical protein
MNSAFVIVCIDSVKCVLYCVCSFVCCVSIDRSVILCDVCYLFVASYCITTATWLNPLCS